MTGFSTTPPQQDSNRPAYTKTESGRHALLDAIRTWHVDRRLRSYRKTALEVCSNYETVRKHIKTVNEKLDSGELEIVGGEVREVLEVPEKS